MFEGDLTALSTADLLDSAAEHRAQANRLDARLLEHAQVYADRHHPDTCPSRPVRRGVDGRERAVVLGGDGCPEIAEFAPAEFALMLGVSPGVAAGFIGEALALRHRFPFTWAKVRGGEATPWKARKIAAACLALPEDAARTVDRRVAGIVDTITPYRLDKIVKAAMLHADPAAARAAAEDTARERGVFVGRSSEHGTKTVYIRAGSGAVIRFKATIASIADALKILGHPGTRNTREAEAVAIIADPAYTEQLLLQARHQLLTQPPTQTSASAPDSPPPAASDAPAPAAPHVPAPSASPTGAHPGPAPQPAPAPDRDATIPATPDPADGAPDDNTPGDSTGGPGHTAADPRFGSDEVLLRDWTEPAPDDKAERDAPHRSQSDQPDPLDAPHGAWIEPQRPDTYETDDGQPLDAAARRALDARLARIRHQAHTNPTTASGSGGRLRPGKTEIYVHLTDHTLATGNGVLRVEDLGPLLADQLAELVGHGPYVVKPVIDLNDAVSVDAYEIPDRIRERIKLIHPAEVFPYGTRETHSAMDLDHLRPYDPLGPPGQKSTTNLAPLGRFTHRVKTHARGWSVRRLDPKTIEWNTPHGFTFHVDPTGTHRVPKPRRSPDLS